MFFFCTHPHRRHVDRFPLERHIGGFENLLHSGGNLRANAIAGNERDFAHFARIRASAIDWRQVNLPKRKRIPKIALNYRSGRVKKCIT